MWLEKRGRKFYASWRDGERIRRKALFSDRRASEARLMEMIKRQERGETGLIDPYEAAKARPLTDHIKDWLESLARKGRSDKYISNADLRFNKVAKSCEWHKLGDVDEDSFQDWLDEQSELSNKTRNHYICTIGAFFNWAVSQKRIAENPIRFMARNPVDGYEKRPRRALSEDELNRLLSVIPNEYKLVYTMAAFTGLRRAELESLEWGDIHLDSPKPFIHLRAETTKSKRDDTLPLRSDLAQWLKEARNEAQDDEKVFARVPSMLRHKTWLKRAGIAWKDNKGRQADFHSLRTTLCTMLNKSGVPVQTAMAIMRHTDIRLTTKTYNDIRLFDTSGALEKLPGITPAKNSEQEKARRTGTDDLPESVESNVDNFRVANRVARLHFDGQKPAFTGTINQNMKSVNNGNIKSEKHGLALTGMDEKIKATVGFEPTVKHVETPISTHNIDTKGSNQGSKLTSEGSKTDLLEAIKFVQSLPLTPEEQADAVRKLLTD